MKKTLIALAAVSALTACAPADRVDRSVVDAGSVASEPIEVTEVNGNKIYAVCASNRIIYVSSTGDVASSDMYCS